MLPLCCNPQVLLKRWLGDANLQDSLLFVGVRGSTNAALGWTVLVAASLTGQDVFPRHSGGGGEQYAWGGLVLMALISVVLTLVITLGIAWTSPLFVRVGSTLTVPASVVFLDVMWHGKRPGWPRLLGAAYVTPTRPTIFMWRRVHQQP